MRESSSMQIIFLNWPQLHACFSAFAKTLNVTKLLANFYRIGKHTFPTVVNVTHFYSGHNSIVGVCTKTGGGRVSQGKNYYYFCGRGNPIQCFRGCENNCHKNTYIGRMRITLREECHLLQTKMVAEEREIVRDWI